MNWSGLMLEKEKSDSDLDSDWFRLILRKMESIPDRTGFELTGSLVFFSHP